MATSMNITHIKLGICSVKENALNEKTYTVPCTMGVSMKIYEKRLRSPPKRAGVPTKRPSTTAIPVVPSSAMDDRAISTWGVDMTDTGAAA